MGRSKWRKIHVEGIDYVWFLRKNEIWTPNRQIRIRHAVVDRGQELLLCPYAWELEIRPKSIREVILFALMKGWTPSVPGPALEVFVEDGRFQVRNAQKIQKR